MSPTQETSPLYAQALRYWQEDALIQYLEADKGFFLARVTPGAGKTYWALRVALLEFNRDRVKRAVVVVPTDAIRKQWIEEAPKLVGLKLADFDSWDNTCQGIVTTYQQVASKSSTEALRGYCREQPTIVILDEIHHASDKNTWGERILSALGGAKIILGLTGTPFRSDGKPVPFVRYKDDLCQLDYSYVYPQALADDIVRRLQFQVYNGTTSWRREGYEATGEVLAQASRRDLPAALGSALDPGSNFARSMIEGAHEKLLELPAGSAGLLVAKDVEHANALAKVLRSVTGAKPWVIHSGPESTGGSARLKAFKESGDKWLVSVRMVSEGVDIPRIRVLCWMTNYMTQLYFEQLIARGLRGPRSEDCWVIMPEHKQLVEMSFAVTHAYIPKLKDETIAGSGRTGGGGERVALEFLGSDGFLSRVFSIAATTESEAMRLKKEAFEKKEALRAKEYRMSKIDDPAFVEKKREQAKASELKRIESLGRESFRKIKAAQVESRMQNEAYRDKMKAYYSDRRSDPAYKEKMKQYLAERRKDPKYKAEQYAKHKAALKAKLLQDPEYEATFRAQHREAQKRWRAKKKAK